MCYVFMSNFKNDSILYKAKSDRLMQCMIHISAFLIKHLTLMTRIWNLRRNKFSAEKTSDIKRFIKRPVNSVGQDIEKLLSKQHH